MLGKVNNINNQNVRQMYIFNIGKTLPFSVRRIPDTNWRVRKKMFFSTGYIYQIGITANYACCVYSYNQSVITKA